MTKPRPKTGEKRTRDCPLKIDRLPVGVRDAIQIVRAEHIWAEVEELSAQPFNPKWQTEGGGFVDWDALPVAVQKFFPDRRLPHTNLHRWFYRWVAQEFTNKYIA